MRQPLLGLSFVLGTSALGDYVDTLQPIFGPEFDPTTLYSPRTANEYHIGRQFSKRDTLRLKKQLEALLGTPLGAPVHASVRQVRAVQQPPSDPINGAAGANGGIIPVTTYVIEDAITTAETADAVVAMLLRDDGLYSYEAVVQQMDESTDE